MKYALITGACKGIGKAIAYECASRKMNVLLISNDAGCLQAVCDDIRRSKGVQSHCLSLDLMDDDAPEKVYQWVRENEFEVNILVNNVGIGKGGTFASMTMKDIRHMMLLNNKVMVEMTYHFLPELQKHKEAYILSLSSLEARLPLPYKAIYTGTKNFIYAFSLAIAQELKFSNIKVSVLCPGPVLTNEEGLSRINAHGSRSKLLMMYPDQVARIAVRAMLRGKQVIVPGRLNAIFFKLGSLLPLGIKMSILERLFRVYKTT
ncbi:MAG TPA: SDR family NAD(P)-dependent oxidoreductase [Chryseosolibacter sp.]|nr:SDR family NAD(P)-dependent oxidoreductase [Chryseosolibacter sp.]